ncbi:hypothetical protein PHJA_001060100 [Phtheirospermum japonicum]|uniref:Uncharacterized protein n=1 Tax=Phtheirospermum japonicum TaxID=374723 RepID=A0A830BY01_9LAMI|nr:hypothetical protein PHJA_001060100 [Phtheirospermum japonicum]
MKRRESWGDTTRRGPAPPAAARWRRWMLSGGGSSVFCPSALSSRGNLCAQSATGVWFCIHSQLNLFIFSFYLFIFR